MQDESAEHRCTHKFRQILQKDMQQYEQKAGRVKFQSRYGKSVFFNLSDEARNQSLRADTLVAHENDSHSLYRTSFSTGYKYLTNHNTNEIDEIIDLNMNSEIDHVANLLYRAAVQPDLHHLLGNYFPLLISLTPSPPSLLISF